MNAFFEGKKNLIILQKKEKVLDSWDLNDILINNDFILELRTDLKNTEAICTVLIKKLETVTKFTHKDILIVDLLENLNLLLDKFIKKLYSKEVLNCTSEDFNGHKKELGTLLGDLDINSVL